MSLKIVGNNIAFYRKRINLTQSELASLLGVSKNTISSYERCEFLPTLDHAVQLCHILHVNFCSLFSVYESDRDLFYIMI